MPAMIEPTKIALIRRNSCNEQLPKRLRFRTITVDAQGLTPEHLRSSQLKRVTMIRQTTSTTVHGAMTGLVSVPALLPAAARLTVRSRGTAHWSARGRSHVRVGEAERSFRSAVSLAPSLRALPATTADRDVRFSSCKARSAQSITY